MRYGEEWQYRRKICQEHFRKEAVKKYHTVISQKVHAMLDGLLRSPKEFEHHNKMCAASIHFQFLPSADYLNAGCLSQFR